MHGEGLQAGDVDLDIEANVLDIENVVVLLAAGLLLLGLFTFFGAIVLKGKEEMNNNDQGKELIKMTHLLFLQLGL